jgi:hypothetical protein
MWDFLVGLEHPSAWSASNITDRYSCCRGLNSAHVWIAFALTAVAVPASVSPHAARRQNLRTAALRQLVLQASTPVFARSARYAPGDDTR